MSGTKRWAAGLFIALIFMYNHVGAFAQGETSAKAACVLELETGRVLFEQNARARLPMASTTKVMTALLAIENGDDYPRPSPARPTRSAHAGHVDLSRRGRNADAGTDALWPDAGQRKRRGRGDCGAYRRKRAAVCAADERAGGFERGAANTHFANPNGLPDDTHVTTAYDLALTHGHDGQRHVSEDCLYPAGRNPMGGAVIQPSAQKQKQAAGKLSRRDGREDGLHQPRGALRFSREWDGMELVGVVLNCSDWFDEAERLMDACFETYTMARVLGPTMAAGKIAVEDGRRESARLCAMQERRVPLHEGESAQIVLDVPQSLRAPGYARPAYRHGTGGCRRQNARFVRSCAERICGKQTADAGCAAGRFAMDAVTSFHRLRAAAKKQREIAWSGGRTMMREIAI